MHHEISEKILHMINFKKFSFKSSQYSGSFFYCFLYNDGLKYIYFSKQDWLSDIVLNVLNNFPNN